MLLSISANSRRVLGEHGVEEGTAHDRHGDRDRRDQATTGA